MYFRKSLSESDIIANKFEALRAMVNPTKYLMCVYLPVFLASDKLSPHQLANYYGFDLCLFLIISIARQQLNSWHIPKIYKRINESQKVFFLP